MKKNKIDVIIGTAQLQPDKQLLVQSKKGEAKTYSAAHILLATGARSRELPHLPIDGQQIIGYREAMSLKKQPKRMLVVGSGAIGVEFAYFYHSIGTEVQLVEMIDRILPQEDEEVSSYMQSHFKKKGMQIHTSCKVEAVKKTKQGIEVHLTDNDSKKQVLTCDVLLSAVGISPNIEGLGLEELQIATGRG